jgi:hypothetical protein
MKLEIDNFDGAGVCDYTAALDAENRPKIVRQLNRISTLTCALVALVEVAAPVTGARVAWRRDSGEALFTGYLTEAAEREYLGWTEAGEVYRYRLTAMSDEVELDRELIAQRPPLVERTAGEAVTAITPTGYDVGSVEDCGTIRRLDPSWSKWSECVAHAAAQTRAAYSVIDSKVALRPIGERAFTIGENDTNFSPGQLCLQSPDKFANDVTVLGDREADAYVKDYFVGDGYSLRYDLSQSPFGSVGKTLVEQEYTGALDPAWWTVADPNHVVSVNSGGLWAQGAGASVKFAELVELSGALQFQHGDVTFQAASDGVIGGLYDGEVCVAGFRIAKAGAQSTISALVNGSVTGSPVTTEANHRYLLTTRTYAAETVRRGERYRSSSEEIGGAGRASDVRVVLEVHDVDLNNQDSLVAPATVLYDGVVMDAPAFCDYTLINAIDLHCSLAYTRIVKLANVLVRSCVPGQSYRTRLVGAMMDGAECNVNFGALQFFSTNPPAANEQIVAEYRSSRRSGARSTTPLNPTEGLNGAPRRPASITVEVASPGARTSEDCANAAKAMLDDATQEAWKGEYAGWSDFVPEVWPGDVMHVKAPSRGCVADAVVREVAIEAMDPANERNWIVMKFANEAAEPLAIATKPSTDKMTIPDAEKFALASLPQAQVMDVTSTSVTLDMGCNAIGGGGFEIRRSDSGWDPQVDRNLVGRFNTRVITVPRLSRVVSYWVRQYDAAGCYSRVATLLHVDYPL